MIRCDKEVGSMGEMWMGIWGISFIGFFIIATAVYDFSDRKKRDQEIKLWKYFLAIVVGLALAFPIVSGIILWILRLPL